MILPNIQPKEPPQGFRSWLALKIVDIAKWIYPESPAVHSFYASLVAEQMIYDEAFTLVKMSDIYTDPSKKKVNRKCKDYPVPSIMKDPKFKKYFN